MPTELPPCPKCGNHNFKVMKLPNPLLLHWVINPGLAINELLLGQRIPEETAECLSCNLPYNERNYVFCPSCRTLNDSRAWGSRRGFGNWLGLVCPACGERIPCIWNYTSRLILAVTYPLWILPVRYYRQHTIPIRPALHPLNVPPAPPKQKTFLRLALFWGGFMFVFMTLIPFIRHALNTGEWNWPALVTGLIIWTLGGLAFGWFMSRFLNKRPTPPQQPPTDS